MVPGGNRKVNFLIIIPRETQQDVKLPYETLNYYLQYPKAIVNVINYFAIITIYYPIKKLFKINIHAPLNIQHLPTNSIKGEDNLLVENF